MQCFLISEYFSVVIVIYKKCIIKMRLWIGSPCTNMLPSFRNVHCCIFLPPRRGSALGQLSPKPRPCLSPKYFTIWCKKKRSVAFKIRQNVFSSGALPQTLLGELTTLPGLPSWLRRAASWIGWGHCPPHPPQKYCPLEPLLLPTA